MILWGVLINAYFLCTFSTAVDEAWNMKNPRPYPKQVYILLNWEEIDFFKHEGEWILREFRETDSKAKEYIRSEYWKKRNVVLKKVASAKR